MADEAESREPARWDLLQLEVLFLGISVCLWLFFLLVGIRPGFWAVAGFTFLNGNLTAIPFATIWPRLTRQRQGAAWTTFLLFLLPVAILSSSLATAVVSLLRQTPATRDTASRTFGMGILITLITGVVSRAIERSRLALLATKQHLEHEVAIGRLQLDSQAADLRAAHEIQARLLPKELPVLRHVEVSCAWQPAQSVGGDYFDVFPLPGGRAAFCMADVCGKGISAALLMANLQAAFRAFAEHSADVGSLCTRLNATLCGVTGPSRFVTFFYGVFDPETRMLEYENAGHPPPVLLRGNEVMSLPGGSVVLGMFAECAYESRRLQLAPGDCLLLATDGILEAASAAGEEFGEERLVESARKALGSGVHGSGARESGAQGVQRGVMEDVEAFCGRQFDDDASLMVLAVS